MSYLSAPKRSYQVCRGIWNPGENDYSWIAASDHANLNGAREAYRELEKVGAKPLALLQVDTRLVEKLPAAAEPVDA